MTGFQIAATIGIPVTVLVVLVLLIAVARPDRDPDGDGLYAVYLAAVSVTTLYMMLVSLAALGEGISEHFAISEQESSLIGETGSSSSYFILGLVQGSDASIAAFAALALFGAIGFGFHHQRRAELRTKLEFTGSAAERVDRAHDAAVCFAMIVLIFIGALIAGVAGYTFFAPPNHGDTVRDVAGGQLLSYGLLVLVAFLIFRSRFWAIRGGRPESDGEDDDINRVPVVEIDEGGTGA